MFKSQSQRPDNDSRSKKSTATAVACRQLVIATVALVLAWIGWTNVASADVETSFPLPQRMLNVVPHGKNIEADWTSDTAYLELGWTPEKLAAQFRALGLSQTIRVGWSNDLLAKGSQSRWFTDLDALIAAGFKLVIVTHTNLDNSPHRFQHYDTAAEGDLPIVDRTTDRAPSWNLFINNWRLIVDRYGNHPDVIGFEPFNEISPAARSTNPGRMYMRDVGAWMDAFGAETAGRGKHVFVEGLWAVTAFWPVENEVDDAGRSFRQLLSLYPNRVHPVVHVYGWFGPFWEQPRSLTEVRLMVAWGGLGPQLNVSLDEQVKLYQKATTLIREINKVCGSTYREWEGNQAIKELSPPEGSELNTLLPAQVDAWTRAESIGFDLNKQLSEATSEKVEIWTGHFDRYQQLRNIPQAVVDRLRKIAAESDEARREQQFLDYVYQTRFDYAANTIQQARRVAGLSSDVPIWVSEIGTSNDVFGPDKPNPVGATQFRALVAASNKNNGYLALWHAIGPAGSFAILPAEGQPFDPNRRAYFTEFMRLD
jgi:hypothetical protein